MSWAVAAWATVVVAAVVWGTVAVADAGVALRAAPFAGRWSWHGGHGLVPAVLVGACVAAVGPRIASRVAWRRVPWLTGGAATVWAAALAAGDGWARLTEPLATRHEYEPFAARIDDLGTLLAGYTDGLAGFPVHVQGHPPGPVVLAWALDRVGLGGAGWLAAVALAGWGAAAAAVLVAARAVCGEPAARRAAPVLAVLPAAVWAGTSLDALFAGLGATGGALAIIAVTKSSMAAAAGAGVVLGVALLCSYGTAAVLVIPLAAAGTLGRAVPRQLARLGLWATAGLAATLAAAAGAGFGWVDGLLATREAYWAGIGGQRPGVYVTLAGNPGALALATGPAVAAGLGLALARLRVAWRAALLPGAALLAVLLADVSQMSRGEVERIWLPFVPWLALAAPGDRRLWLAAQVALALLLQSFLVSPW